MKIEINTHVEFFISDVEESDLAIALKVEWDDFASERLRFEDILNKQLRGLTPAEKRDCKKRIARRVKIFLAILEK